MGQSACQPHSTGTVGGQVGKLLLGTLDVTMAHVFPFDRNDSINKKYFLLSLNPVPLDLTLPWSLSRMVWGGYVLNTTNLYLLLFL